MRSGCPEDCKVTHATGTLLDEAQSWWNAIVQNMGTEEAYQISWVEFKRKILKKYCSRSEIKKLEDEFHYLAVKGVELRACNHRFQ